jgi:hypothetical protein
MTPGSPYRPDGIAPPTTQNPVCAYGSRLAKFGLISPFSFQDAGPSSSSVEHDTPHLIMTYCALLLLSMLRDDFSRLDRPGLIKFLRTCQKPDGSFSTVPGDTESDLRTLYCAFAISTMLDDWSGIDVERALTFVESCRVRTSLSNLPSLIMGADFSVLVDRRMKGAMDNLPSAKATVVVFKGLRRKAALTRHFSRIFCDPTELELAACDELCHRPRVEEVVCAQYLFGRIHATS